MASRRYEISLRVLKNISILMSTLFYQALILQDADAGHF